MQHLSLTILVTSDLSEFFWVWEAQLFCVIAKREEDLRVGGEGVLKQKGLEPGLPICAGPRLSLET